MCPYCDGHGHSGNDCPTDAKIAHLRGGVQEQNKFLQATRKALRKASGMADVTGFSLLSASEPKPGTKRNRKQWAEESATLSDSIFSKRPRW